MGRHRVQGCVTGKYVRQPPRQKAHSMFMTWASHIKIMLGTSEGQGYSIGLLQEYIGLPPHSLIPKGLEFTTSDDLAIQNFLSQTTEEYRILARRKYLDGEIINRYRHEALLESAYKWLFT